MKLPPLAREFADGRPDYAPHLRRYFNVLAEWRRTRAECMAAYEELRATYAAATVHVTMSSAREFYRWLLLRGDIEANPTEGLRVSLRKNIPMWNVLREGEDEKLLGAATAAGPLCFVVVTAILQHGMRASELCHIRWTDVRQEGDRLTVEWVGKGQKPMVKRLKGRTVEAIQQHRASLGLPAGKPGQDGWLLVGDAGGRGLTRLEVWRMVRGCAEAVGLRVTPHGLRASYISRLVQEKGIEAARQSVGHENISTTQRYSRWDVRDDTDD